MATFSFSHKIYIVLGLARSGLATVRWLLDRGAVVFVSDNDTRKQQEAIQLGAQELVLSDIHWTNVAALIQSPGISLSHPLTRLAKQHYVPVMGDCDLFRQAYPEATIVGITGTNGKSTTTALVGHILKEAGIPVAVGGNIGIPVLALPQLPPEGIYVWELSSYQLDLSHPLSLTYVGWVNISPDHLERHGTMEAYCAAKEKIFDCSFVVPKGVMLIDDDISYRLYQKMIDNRGKDHILPVSAHHSLTRGLELRDGVLYRLYEGGGNPSSSEKIMNFAGFSRLSGQHNYENMAIAYGVCERIGLDRASILAGMATFPGLVHRQEWVGEQDGVFFVNDSKATNAQAASKALNTYDHIFWIAGGEPKTDGIHMLRPYFSKIHHAYLIGVAQDTFAQTLEGGDGTDKPVCYTRSGDLKTALTQAYEAARSFISQCREAGKEDEKAVILFSPACASFDQFRDFEHRGNVFRELVGEYTSSR